MTTGHLVLATGPLAVVPLQQLLSAADSRAQEVRLEPPERVVLQGTTFL